MPPYSYPAPAALPRPITNRTRTLTRIPAAALVLTVLTGMLLAGCGGAGSGPFKTQPSFTFSLSPSSLTLYPGGTQSLQVKLEAQNGFQGKATVSFAGLPSDVTPSPSSFQLSPGESATVVLTAGLSAAAERFKPYSIGQDSAAFSVAVRGIADSLRGTGYLKLAVNLQNPDYVPSATDLPVVWITTQDNAPIDSTETYVPGTLVISSDLAGANVLQSGAMQIKGRGHTTWYMPKKPYRIKLDTKASLLGMPSDKDWNLLANYNDKTLMRNAVAFELSRRLGMPWTPRSAFVELFLNGRYDGTYQLTEKIKAAKDRVNITRMAGTDTSGDALTGGFLMEIDARLDGTSWFYTHQNVPIVIQDPDPPLAEQSDYIRNYVVQAEDALFSGSFADPDMGWPAYFDARTFIDWYLVNETTGNVDASFFSSCWLYKERMNPLLYMGPVWDFDISMGNVDYATVVYPTGWWVQQGPWYSRFFQDPNYAAAVAARWKAVKTTELDTLPAFVDQTAAALSLAQQNNFQRWPILGQWVWPNSECAGSYAGEVEFLNSWLSQRIAWMDSQFN